jgi:hypothetical protein
MWRLMAVIGVCAAAVAMARGSEAKAPAGKPLRLLFVGNSYTFYNDLPRLVAALLQTTGRKVEIGEYLAGSRTLMNHWNENLGVPSDPKHNSPAKEEAARKGGFDKLLAQGPWDYVVLQGHSRDALDGEPWEFRKYAGLFAEKIRKASPETKVLFYMTWARQDQPQEQPIITKAYLEVAKANAAAAAPVGEAWKDSLAARPDLVLHITDKKHPTAAGSYLAGCVFYATITGQSPVGLPAKIDGIRQLSGPTYDLKAADARFLQDIAAKTMERMKAGE